MKTILILASNPKGTSVLDLDREIRDIREGLRRSPNGDDFDIEMRGADRTIKPWDLATGEKRSPKHILEGHTGRGWYVAVSPDGSKVASASADFTVKLWDIQTEDLLQTLTGHLGEVRAVAFSPDGNLLASGGDDLEIKLWKL